MRPVLAGVAFLVLPACFSGCPSRVRGPELTVLVTDETGKPIEGMQVDRAVHIERGRGKVLGLLPLPEPTLGYRLEVLQGGRTDGAGRMVSAGYTMTIGGADRVSGETLLVNAHADPAQPEVAELTKIIASTCHSSACEWPATDVGVSAWLIPSRDTLLVPRNGDFSGVVVLLHEPPEYSGYDSQGSPLVSKVQRLTTRIDREDLSFELRRQSPGSSTQSSTQQKKPEEPTTGRGQ